MIEKSDEMRNANHSRFQEESGKGKTPSSCFFEFFWTFINKVDDSISKQNKKKPGGTRSTIPIAKGGGMQAMMAEMMAKKQ